MVTRGSARSVAGLCRRWLGFRPLYQRTPMAARRLAPPASARGTNQTILAKAVGRLDARRAQALQRAANQGIRDVGSWACVDQLHTARFPALSDHRHAD